MDFGLARTDVFDTNENHMTGQAGTFNWMAPEAMQSSTTQTTKSDVYSFGIVLWEIICREPPFNILKPHEIMVQVLTNDLRPDMSKVPSDCPKEFIDLIEHCWKKEPADRPDFSTIIKVLKAMEQLFKK